MLNAKYYSKSEENVIVGSPILNLVLFAGLKHEIVHKGHRHHFSNALRTLIDVVGNMHFQNDRHLVGSYHGISVTVACRLVLWFILLMQLIDITLYI